MKLEGILSISGYGGLFKVLTKKKNGLIVEELETKKRMQVNHNNFKVNILESIEIFTYDDDLPLIDVFKNIYKKENGGKAIDKKSSSDDLKKYFYEVLENYDKERVYVSNIKKIISWYNILHKKGIMKFEEEEKEVKENTEENS